MLSEIDAKDYKNWTTLHKASKFGFLHVVEVLVIDGANLNVKTNEGKTPLHYASQEGHYQIVQYLIKKHAFALGVRPIGAPEGLSDLAMQKDDFFHP